MILTLASPKPYKIIERHTFCILACLIAPKSSGESLDMIIAMIQCCGGPSNSFWRQRTSTLKVACTWISRKDESRAGSLTRATKFPILEKHEISKMRCRTFKVYATFKMVVLWCQQELSGPPQHCIIQINHPTTPMMFLEWLVNSRGIFQGNGHPQEFFQGYRDEFPEAGYRIQRAYHM